MPNQHTKRREQGPDVLPGDQALIQAQAEREQIGTFEASPKRSIPKPDPIFAHHVAVGPSNEEIDKLQRQLDELRAKAGYPKVELVSDAHDKQWDAAEDTEYDPLGVMDPLAVIKKQYGKPDMALKLMSNHVTNRLGRRGYQIVKDSNGDPVKCGTMVLGEIPEHLAVKRRRLGPERSNEELQAITNASREQVEKLKFEARGLGLQVINPGEMVRNDGDGQDYQMGISVQRGDE